MTDIDRKTFCKALAFTALFVANGIQIIKAGKDAGIAKSDQKALQLAEEMEAFCFGKMETVADAEIPDELDRAIDRHISELRTEETTVLPQDRETLVKFYDRLHQSKTRRTQVHFYETANARLLADAVLKLLDEEINHEERS